MRKASVSAGKGKSSPVEASTVGRYSSWNVRVRGNDMSLRQRLHLAATVQ
jgi:hypothetical protein